MKAPGQHTSVLIFLLVLAAHFSVAQDLKSLSWMSRDWSYTDDDIMITESWSYMNDSTLVGSSVTMRNDSMIFEEALKIEQRLGAVRYIALLPTKLATFQLDELTDNKISFVDDANDFPKKIEYERLQKNMIITLSGNGKSIRRQFSPVKPR